MQISSSKNDVDFQICLKHNKVCSLNKKGGIVDSTRGISTKIWKKSINFYLVRKNE
jgi:hypothetical protein